MSAPWLGWGAYALVVAALVASGDLFAMYLAGLVFIYAISALGLDWIQGRAGQVSIGSAAFMAVGAYVTATAEGVGAPLVVACALAAAAGAIVGLAVGIPALRLRGLYLALSTLALHFITSSLALQYETMTGRSAGFSVPQPAIGPLEISSGPVATLALAAVLALVIVGLHDLYRTAPGRAWLAIKESEVTAAVVGVYPTRWKLLAFVGSSALISFSGALLAAYTLRVFYDTFSLQFALGFVVMVIVGGLGSIPGVLLGAALVTVSPYILSSFTAQLPPSLPIQSWLERNVYYVNNGLYGVLVLVFLLYQPRGIAGALEEGGRWISARVTRRAGRPPRRGGASPAPTAGPAPILAVRDLTLVYRTGARALDGIDLDIRPGEIVALLGRNGAGKTSVLRAISGFFIADRVRLGGSIAFDGAPLAGLSPVATSRRGVILVPERDKVFPDLTVAEHLRVAGATQKMRAEVEELFPPLRARAGSPAGLLSGGERQMLALAVAMCMRPRLLLIDELSLGLAPVVAKRLMTTVRELRDRTGVPILLVEQNVSSALEVADRAYVLEAGRVAHSGAASEVSRAQVVGTAFGTT